MWEDEVFCLRKSGKSDWRFLLSQRSITPSIFQYFQQEKKTERFPCQMTLTFLQNCGKFCDFPLLKNNKRKQITKERISWKSNENGILPSIGDFKVEIFYIFSSRKWKKLKKKIWLLRKFFPSNCIAFGKLWPLIENGRWCVFLVAGWLIIAVSRVIAVVTIIYVDN